MSQCPRCGASTTEGQAFCASCGGNLTAATGPSAEETTQIPGPSSTASSAAAPPTQQWSPPPQGLGGDPGQSHGGYGTSPAGVGIDLTRLLGLLRGNWTGMALVALTTFATALVVAALFAFTTADRLDVKSALGATALLTGSTFGADLVQDLGDDTTLSLGQFPLLGTFLALGAATWTFRRATAQYARLGDALADALRAALVLSLLLTALAIVVKIIEPDLRGYESNGPDNDFTFLAMAVAIPDGKTTLSVAGAIFLGFLLVAVVLGVASLTRRDWLPAKLGRVHDVVAAPVAGYVALCVALLPAGLVYVGALAAEERRVRGFPEVMSMLANLPGLGLHLVGLGSLAELGIHVQSSDPDTEGFLDDAVRDDGGTPARVWHFAGEHGALFWISLLVVVAVAAVAVGTVMRRSVGTARPLVTVGAYLGSLLFMVPLLVRLANAHIASEDARDDVTFTGGLDGVQTTFLFLVVSAVVALVLLVATGSPDLSALRAKAASLQANPGVPPRGPQQGGWQQPPPHQQGGWQQPQGGPAQGSQPPWQPPPGPLGAQPPEDPPPQTDPPRQP